MCPSHTPLPFSCPVDRDSWQRADSIVLFYLYIPWEHNASDGRDKTNQERRRHASASTKVNQARSADALHTLCGSGWEQYLHGQVFSPKPNACSQASPTPRPGKCSDFYASPVFASPQFGVPGPSSNDSRTVLACTWPWHCLPSPPLLLTHAPAYCVARLPCVLRHAAETDDRFLDTHALALVSSCRTLGGMSLIGKTCLR
ncbi:hypothetical protein V8C34DRAFT_277614 [Trichoderma compactum]